MKADSTDEGSSLLGSSHYGYTIYAAYDITMGKLWSLFISSEADYLWLCYWPDQENPWWPLTNGCYRSFYSRRSVAAGEICHSFMWRLHQEKVTDDVLWGTADCGVLSTVGCYTVHCGVLYCILHTVGYSILYTIYCDVLYCYAYCRVQHTVWCYTVYCIL